MAHSLSNTLAVIIPCWNCEQYIGEMLECIHNQTFLEWKAYLVDDGCTDGTAQIIKDYAQKDSRINYVLRNRGPKGAQTCRNIGFALSEGAEFVVFLDADDLIAPFCFMQRVCFLQTHPSIDFASFPLKAFKQNIYDDTYWGFGVPGNQELLVSLLNWKTLQIVVASNIYRRKSLSSVGVKWDEHLRSMQDADFNIQSLTKGLSHLFAEESRIDYFYRQCQSTTVSKRIFDSSMFDSHLCLIEKVVSSIQKAYHNKYDFYLKAFIVNFFSIFNKNSSPYFSLLRLAFIKKNPVFFCQISLFLLLGMRGKKRLFKKYVSYSTDSARSWSSLVSETIKNRVKAEALYGE